MNAAVSRPLPQTAEPEGSVWTSLRPPHYLLGAALLVWGHFADWLFLGITFALALEGARRVTWRWTFSDEDFVRIWNLCVALFLTVVVFQFVDRDMHGWSFTKSIQKWLPVVLAPMILAHHYSVVPGVPIVIFSLVARRKRAIDERAGRPLKPVRRFHLGYFYFAVLLLSIGSVAPNEDRTSFLIVGGLVAWALYGFIPPGRRIVASVLFPFVFCLAYGLQFGLRRAQMFLHYRAEQWLYGQAVTDDEEAITRIGALGRLKLSMDIDWRVKSQVGTAPRLLREAAYHDYSNGVWRNHLRLSDTPVKHLGDRDEWEVYNLPTAQSTGVLRIRGRVPIDEAVIPAPANTGLFVDLPATELERNAMGTFVGLRMRHSVLDYLVFQGRIPSDYSAQALRPDAVSDLHIDREDKRAIDALLAELPLDDTPSTRHRLAAVENLFHRGGFAYSRFLEHSRPETLHHFLMRDHRRGHCEYFATATALLLRHLGVPARYVVGYAVREYDDGREEYLLRGMHRHAWVEAWVDDEQAWTAVDTTPPSWLEAESERLTAWQRFRDRWDRWMTGWHLWRRSEDKGLLWVMLPIFLAGILLITVVIRLLRGLKQQNQADCGKVGNGTESPRLGVDSRWFALELALAVRGEPRAPHVTTYQWCDQLGVRRPAWRERLKRITQLHYRYRFDPNGIDASEVKELGEQADELLAGLREEEGKRQRREGL